MSLFILLFSSFVSSLYAYNYQTVEHWRYLRQEQPAYQPSKVPSYFGYSLAVHRSSLLIGAPRDQSPYDVVTRRGAVWRCDFQSDGQCQRLPFRRDGEANVRVGTSFDNKTDQWLGASVVANNDNVIAGSPFLKHRINDGQSLEYEIPGGAMIGKYDRSSSMANSTQIYSPSFLNWHSRNYNQEGYGLFGFQVTLSRKPERIIISSPGSFYFRGGIHSIPILEHNWIDTRHPFIAPHYPWREVGWLRYPSNYSSNEYDDWCYRGYAVAVGNFNEDDNQEIVVSVPKLHNYRGAVEILNSKLDESSVRTLNGTQMGEYFGASLCVTDINQDGLDDLLVGAPLYTVKKEGRILPDAGRVDIYYQTAEHNLIHKQTIEGVREGGRLGHAIASLGDIDKDGYNDVAISIPYANSGSSSTVHIYRGSKDGLILTPSQTLQTTLNGFGWALQGQFDYDNNGYLDLAVSSTQTETVAIILARPILHVQTRVQHNLPTIPLNCTLHSDNGCFVLTICIHVNDQNYQHSKRDTLTYELHLDKDKNPADQRVFFRETLKSVKKRHFKTSDRICHDYSLYMKIEMNYYKEGRHVILVNERSTDDVEDKLKPIRLQINYGLVSKLDANIVPPILDPANSTFNYFIPIQKDCGYDDVCVPNLHLNTSYWPDIYKVGLTKKILLDISVVNTGENAYDTQCAIQLPVGVEYVRSNTTSTVNLYCHLLKQSDRVVVCQLGNPLLANGNISVQIHTAVNNYSAIQADPLIFSINITSENPDTRPLTTDILLPVASSPELVFIGVAKPEQIVLDSSDNNLLKQAADLEIVHTYTLHNKGPSDAKRTEVKLMWPLMPFWAFNEQQPLLHGIDLPLIIRVSDPKAKIDRCHIYQPTTSHVPSADKDGLYPVTLPDSSSIERLQDSSLSTVCRGPLCKSFICYIDMLPIGHSVLIQLKAMLRLNQLQTKFDRSKPFLIVSNASAQVREIPLKPPSNQSSKQAVVYLKLETQIPPAVERSSQNWVWLIALSITAGVTLLIILVGVLWCCGFFKRRRPMYPVSMLVDSPSPDCHYHVSSSSPQSGRLAAPGDAEDLSSDIDDNQLMIHNPAEKLPIVVPHHSSHFIQQQQQRTQYPYYPTSSPTSLS